MNTKKTIHLFSIITSTLLVAVLITVPANAQTVGVNASVTTSGTTTQITATTRLPKIISQSDTAITARITDLNKLDARIQAMKNVSATEKAAIANEVQTNINGLTSLKTKIDADTDVTTARTDDKSIFGSYRIYALIIPRGYIVASADRINTIVDMMTTLSAKLQARITADQTAGKDVATLQTALADLNVKIGDAKSQASVAENGVTALMPDQGNQTKLQVNTTALKAARANIKTATQDLQAARQDVKTIVQGLKAFNIKASATTSATVGQ